MVSLLLLTMVGATSLQAPAVRVTEEVRLGTDSVPEYQFTQIRQGVQDPSGNLYLLLPREAEVRVFSPDGRFLRRLGRKGQGPGEFMTPVALGWRADTLWIRDVQLNRVTLLTRDGRWVRTIQDRMPALSRRYVPGPPAVLLSDGSLLGVGDAPSTIVASGQITEVPVVRFLEGGGDVKHLRDLSLANLYGQQPPGPQQPGIHFQQRLSDAPLWHAAQDGSAIVIVDRGAAESGREASFELTVIDASGTVRQRRRLSYVPKSLSRSVRDSVVTMTLNPMGLPNVQLSPEAVYTPRFLPPVTDVFLATNGHIWLRREFTLEGSVAWDLLDTRLQRIGTVMLPADFRMLTVLGDRIWGWRTDTSDVPYVVQYAVTVTS